MKTDEERFTTIVRRPYKEVMTVVLKSIDFHNEMILRDPEHKYFHEKQRDKLKSWMIDMKEYIHEQERRID